MITAKLIMLHSLFKPLNTSGISRYVYSEHKTHNRIWQSNETATKCLQPLQIAVLINRLLQYKYL